MRSLLTRRSRIGLAGAFLAVAIGSAVLVQVGGATANVAFTPAPVASPVPADASRTVAVPSSIDSSGATNVSDRLHEFFATVPSGSTVVFRARGTYRVEPGLRLYNRSDLVIDGNGATLRGIGWDRAILAFWGGERIVIRNLALVGDNEDAGNPAAYHAGGQEYSAGLLLYGVSDVDISDVTIVDVWGDCLHVGANGPEHTWSENVAFHDSTCRRNGRNAVTLNAGRNVTVERVAFDEVAMHVLDIEPDYTQDGATNVRFADNTVGSYGLTNTYVSFFFAANGVDGSTVRDITVSGNRVTGNLAGYDGKGLGLHVLVDSARRQNIAVSNNRADAPADGASYPGAVMYFSHVDGVTVTGNVQPLSAGVLTRFADCTRITRP